MGCPSSESGRQERQVFSVQENRERVPKSEKRVPNENGSLLRPISGATLSRTFSPLTSPDRLIPARWAGLRNRGPSARWMCPLATVAIYQHDWTIVATPARPLACSAVVVTRRDMNGKRRSFIDGAFYNDITAEQDGEFLRDRQAEARALLDVAFGFALDLAVFVENS